jgi:hypothetical protein
LSNELTDLPEIHTLRGFEAVEALDIYAHNLEIHRGRDLTKAQKQFLIKAAKILRETITSSNDYKQKET